METENDFEVKEENGKVIVKQSITKTMSMPEAVSELQKLAQEKQQVKEQKDKLQTYVNTEQYKKDLDQTIKNEEDLNKLEENWQNIVKPAIEKAKNQLKTKIKTLKAEKGYDRITDGNKKVLTKNEIISKAITELQIDPQNPAIQEIRREFDKI